MAIASRRGPITAEQYLDGQETRNQYLLDGEVVVDDPTHRHQRVCANLLLALQLWVRSDDGHGRAGYGGNWVLAPTTVVAPDVWWMADPAGPGDSGRWDGPPDLVVEVLSPGTRRYDLGRKRDRYLEAGLPEHWLVDPWATTVVATRRDGGDATFGPGDVLISAQLPGFALAVDHLPA